MLDLACGLQESRSRLGCQLRLRPELSGLRVDLPEDTNDLYYAP